jgi:hypothetical protein
MTGASLAGGSLMGSSLAVDSLAASPQAAGWPANGWDGADPGEIAHSPATSRRPPLEPVPKSIRPKSADAGAAKPPWAPAVRPDGHNTPAPVMPSAWFPSDPASGIRLPGGMPEPPLTPEGFEGPDLTAPFVGRDVLSQSGLGLAAAPVPTDHPVPADFSAPTEIFPALTDPEMDDPA